MAEADAVAQEVLNPAENTAESDAKLKSYTLEEISAHNTEESTWIIIHNRVYDVTRFMAEHPGGPGPLTDLAGEDATEDFEDTFHSKSARNLCKEHLVGKVSDSELGDLHAATRSQKTEESSYLNVLISLVVVAAAIFYFGKAHKQG